MSSTLHCIIGNFLLSSTRCFLYGCDSEEAKFSVLFYGKLSAMKHPGESFLIAGGKFSLATRAALKWLHELQLEVCTVI